MRKLYRYGLVVLLSFIFGDISMGFAQQTRKVTEKFFPEPDIEMDLPIFKKKNGYTTHWEMMDFIAGRIAMNPSLFSMEIVGKSQRNRDIPLVKVSMDNGQEDKLRIFYYARVHGDEPAGTEGVLLLMRKFAENESVRSLLERVDFYLMPMVNPDGAESHKRPTANGVDLNRDQSRLETPEAVILHAVANKIQPHVAIDFHEYRSVRSDFSKITSDIITTPWDVMFLFTSNPNVPEVLRNEILDPFAADARKVLDENGLTHHTYFTSRDDFGNIVFNLGGSSPRSTSNIMALKNMISILFEVRGVGLERTSIKRRINTVYLLALSYANTAIKNESRLREVIAASEKDRSDIAVSFSPEKKVLPYEFIDVVRNRLVTLNVESRMATNPTVTLSRPVPSAYYILPSASEAVEKLQQMGVKVERLNAEITVPVEAFTVTSMQEDGEQVNSIYPMKVTTRIAEKTMTFPAGSYRVNTGQNYVHVATVMLEPESANGFVNYRVINVKQNEEIPVYRAK